MGSQQREAGVPSHTLHTVTPADTLQGLSLRYGVSVDEIKKTNRIFSDKSLHIFNVIKIPSVPNTSFLAPACGPTHTDSGSLDGGEGRRGVVRVHDLLQQCQDTMDRTMHYLNTRDSAGSPIMSPGGSPGASRDGRTLAQVKAERQRRSTSSLQGEHSETVRRVSRELRLSQEASLNDDLNSSVPDDIFTL
eukprot:comp21900_c0_seq1/m.31398 comp21900_c0_seq1/g.31398  ORF comp21900_c0_seq1/g.31398 comp21900_c0_seq1/m.31398 type:complete len:191 (-) comp21900_c0_seq1:126-698(-)